MAARSGALFQASFSRITKQSTSFFDTFIYNNVSLLRIIDHEPWLYTKALLHEIYKTIFHFVFFVMQILNNNNVSFLNLM